MSMIRNGGFERGSGDFWELVALGAFTVQTTEKMHGNYGARVVSSAALMQGIITKDYLGVCEGELINMHCWTKTSDATACRFRVYGYDSDYNLIDSDYAGVKEGGAGWIELFGQYRCAAGVSYIRIAITTVFLAADQSLYIDSVSASHLSAVEVLQMVRELADITNRTTSGNSLANAQEMLGFREYYAEISVTSLTGTTPTMDMLIKEYDEVGYVRTLGAFTQATGATNQRVGIARPIGHRLHAVWTMGGTVTDCDFKVNVIGVR